jgi:hypothetical protein
MPSSEITKYIGKIFTFSDLRSIKIIDVKIRDLAEIQYWVTYEVKFSAGGIPKRMQMPEKEFISYYGHLFFNNPQQ